VFPSALSPEQRARYVRQLMLPQIGEKGQQRICATVAAVAVPAEAEAMGEHNAHRVACLYAERAGFMATCSGTIAVETLAPPSLLSHAAARQALAGARAVVACLHQALDAEGSSSEARGAGSGRGQAAAQQAPQKEEHGSVD
jgi:hypothetical protein